MKSRYHLHRKMISGLNLACFFLLHLLRRIFLRSGGIQRFQKNYLEVKILSLEDKKMFQGLGRCTACGDCDKICPALKQKNEIHFLGPMAVPLSYARSLYFLDKVQIPWDICKDCGECEKVCPENVPLNRALKWLVSK
ncbi:MAG: 4Fe-4S dicluster domain-containing protein [Deltaproteobacteria bacterium]|nr:4Fe-4S dicluster domain-containing protein [Deltaproteobacteria bacterium]